MIVAGEGAASHGEEVEVIRGQARGQAAAGAAVAASKVAAASTVVIERTRVSVWTQLPFLCPPVGTWGQ